MSLDLNPPALVAQLHDLILEGRRWRERLWALHRDLPGLERGVELADDSIEALCRRWCQLRDEQQ